MAWQEKLLHEIESQGMATSVTGQMAVVAHVLQRQGEERAFVEDIQRQIMAGNMSPVADMVSAFNHGACAPSSVGRFTPLANLRAAVGD